VALRVALLAHQSLPWSRPDLRRNAQTRQADWQMKNQPEQVCVNLGDPPALRLRRTGLRETFSRLARGGIWEPHLFIAFSREAINDNDF